MNKNFSDFKVGEYLRCKKFYKYSPYVKFYFGSEYLIVNTSENFIEVNTTENFPFLLNYNELSLNFYTKQEIRELKLKKIKKLDTSR